MTTRPHMRVTKCAFNGMANEALAIWARTSARPMMSWGRVPDTLLPYLEHVYRAVGDPLEYDSVVPTRPVADAPPARDDGTIWVAYSGGKDGMAAALTARLLGATPVLYHVAGLNRNTASEERQWARAGAAAAGMDLVVDEVTITGQNAGFIEMPTKNQVIAGLMVGRMLELGGTHWTMGVHQRDTQDRMRPDLDWSDGATSVRLFAKHVHARVPGSRFGYLVPAGGETAALAVCALSDMLEYVHGCMTPARHWQRVRDANERKYGTSSLLPGRCGSCTKCVTENLNLVALGVLPHDGLHDHSLAKARALLAKEAPEGTTDPVEYYVDAIAVEAYHATRALSGATGIDVGLSPHWPATGPDPDDGDAVGPEMGLVN